MSGKTVRDTVTAIGFIASMVFVGFEIRTSNLQARAAAYQAIGIATSEFHRDFDARLNRLETEGRYPEATARWTLQDWEAISRMWTADLRMVETILLQVEQGLLPDDAMERLGYNWVHSIPALERSDLACLWPQLRLQVGSEVRRRIEGATPRDDWFNCQIDLESLRDRAARGELDRSG